MLYRGKTVQESRAHNAQIAAEELAYRNEQRSVVHVCSTASPVHPLYQAGIFMYEIGSEQAEMPPKASTSLWFKLVVVRL